MNQGENWIMGLKRAGRRRHVCAILRSSATFPLSRIPAFLEKSIKRMCEARGKLVHDVLLLPGLGRKGRQTWSCSRLEIVRLKLLFE